MSVQIDMTKFLESLVDDKNGFHQLTVLDILNALNSMGLTIGFNGEIERIVAEPKQVPEGWYVCKKAFSYPKLDGYLPVFVEGESTPKEKVFAAIPYMTEELFNEHFRPATEEEIRAIVSIKPEPLSPAPQRNNYDEIKQAEPKQENSPILSNSSNTAKNDELTEFEVAIRGLVGYTRFGKLEDMSWEQYAINKSKELLSIARREIAEGIENDRIVMSNNRFADVPQEDRIRFDSYFYAEGIRDVVKKLKED